MDRFEARGYGEDAGRLPELLEAHARGEAAGAPAGLRDFRARVIEGPAVAGGLATGLLVLEISGPGDRRTGDEARTILGRVLLAEAAAAGTRGRSFAAVPVEFEAD